MAEEKKPDIALTADQREKVVAWLKDKTGDSVSPCPVCRQRKFIIGDHAVTPPIFSPGGGFLLGGPAYPSVLLICDNCGTTQFLNAVKMGLFTTSTGSGESK